VVAWVGARVWDYLSAELTLRRTFVQETTKRVVQLSETHYWALANAAGTLAGRLDEHLRQVELLLFTPWRIGDTAPDPAAADRLREAYHDLAARTSRESFPALVRLLWALERFQLRGSNTYLVPDHAAGDGLRRLYNRFVASLPPGDFVSELRRRVEEHLAKEDKTTAGDLPPGIHGSFLEHRDRLQTVGLDGCRDRWEAWLRDAPASVEEAATALRAFATLLAHEMALLNRVFFRDAAAGHDAPTTVGRAMAVLRRVVLPEAGAPHRSASALAAQAAAADRWPGVLDAGAALALRRVEEESVFFAPLGGIGARMPSPKPLRDTAADYPRTASEEPLPPTPPPPPIGDLPGRPLPSQT